MGSRIEAVSSHIGLCVADMDRSLRFYCEGLGFTRVVDYELTDAVMPGLDRSLEVTAPVAVRSQFVELGTMKIELLAFASPAASGRPSQSRATLGFTHLSFHVDDVDSTAAHLVDCGGTVIETTRANLGIEVVFLADPDGARVELMAPKPR